MDTTLKTEENKNDFTEMAMEAMAQATEQANNLTAEPILNDQDAKDVAKLKAYVRENKLALEREGKTYLRCEAWQYILAMKGLSPSFDSVSEVYESNGANGKKVRQYVVTTNCELKNKETGVTISRATMIASNYESFLKNKPLYATWGMSQTRALSRAVRNVYGYIAVGAGFQAVPWEEVQS